MHNKEIVNAICANHLYEYLIVNKSYEVVGYSAQISQYCDELLREDATCDFFCAVPELVGMEQDLAQLLEGKSTSLSLPLIFKAPDQYVNIHVHQGTSSQTFIVLFENITEITHAQQQAMQNHNENLLLLDEIADKNRRLQIFSQKMKELVDEEIAKNVEKQHMLELQTRHAQMGEMIALITHQWKQPLSVIQSVCANVKLKHELGKLSPGFFMDKVDNILNQAKHMNSTVVDFQKFFTPSKAKSKFNLNENINTLLDLVAVEYVHANITLNVIGDEEVWIEGYPNEYNQVILSLLQNAREAFLSHPSDHMKITIDISKEEEHSHVSIADNAGGISSTVLPKIFNQYETSKSNGSGLGLYIAKSVIEGNMGGKIWAENSEEGAVFHIVI
jgi:signal transduction histidine kinase